MSARSAVSPKTVETPTNSKSGCRSTYPRVRASSTSLPMSVSKTMRLAQGLYEGREIGDAGTVGLITYMRTDSTRVSDEAIGAAPMTIKPV